METAAVCRPLGRPLSYDASPMAKHRRGSMVGLSDTIFGIDGIVCPSRPPAEAIDGAKKKKKKKDGPAGPRAIDTTRRRTRLALQGKSDARLASFIGIFSQGQSPMHGRMNVDRAGAGTGSECCFMLERRQPMLYMRGGRIH